MGRGRPRIEISQKQFEGLVLTGNGSFHCAQALGVTEDTMQTWIGKTYGRDPKTGKPHIFSSVAPTIKRNFGNELLANAKILSMKSPDLMWKLLKNFSVLTDNPTPEQSEAKPSAFLQSLDRLADDDGDAELDGIDIPQKEDDNGSNSNS